MELFNVTGARRRLVKRGLLVLIIRVSNLKKLENLLKRKKFVVYGAGCGGCLLIENFCKAKDLLPIFITDKKFKKIEKFLGIPGLPLSNFESVAKTNKKLIVVVSISQHHILKEVLSYLRSLNLEKIIVLSFKCFWELEKKFYEEDVKFKLKSIDTKENINRNFSINENEKIFKNNFCLLHIGWIKAGSTSIQFSLVNVQKNSKYIYDRSNFFEYNNVIFLENDLKKIGWFPKFSNLFIIERRINFLTLVIKILKKAWQQNKNLIISSEHIPFLSYSNLIFLKALITKFFPNVCVFGYIREPYSFIPSCFQEWLKNKFLDFTELQRCYLGYKVHFEKFIKIFGKNNTILKKFDPKKFPNGDVVKDFCQFWGINLSNRSPVKINVSFPKEIVSLIYTLRKYSHSDKIYFFHVYFLTKLIIKDLLPDYEFTPFKISKEVIKPIVEANIEDVRWMEKVLGEPLIDEEALKEPEPDWVIKKEEDLLTLPDEVIEALRDYTNYKLSNTKPMPQQVAEMLYQILKENFPDL